MKRRPPIVLSLITVTVLIAGCYPNKGARYYLKTEKMPNGTITSLIDAKYNTQLLYIDELSLNPPSITVLPISRLDIESVSVGSSGEEEVLISFKEQDNQNQHSVMVSDSYDPMKSVLHHVDMDKDGKIDVRTLRFQTESGFTQYLDFDANGILDAQLSMTLGDASSREARILVGECWLAVEGDSSNFHVLRATSKGEFPAIYHFQDGAWSKTDASPAS